MNEISYLTRAKLKSLILTKQVRSISNLQQLKEQMLSLDKPIHANNLVFGDGLSHNPEYMFIGEGPGEEEDKTGIPFVGKSGKLLRNIITIFNRSYYITNVVPYRPPNNRNPTDSEINLWKPYLIQHIKFVNPKNIVLVGKVAAHTLLETEKHMSELRLNIYTICNINAFIFYHPSYLLRSPKQKSKAYEDIKFIMKSAI